MLATFNTPFGRCARAIMDDVYAIGPARVVFPAVQRFAMSLKEGTGLSINASKSACYSSAYALEDCLPCSRRLKDSLLAWAIPAVIPSRTSAK